MGWLTPALPKLLFLAMSLQVALLLVASWRDLSSRLIPDRACIAVAIIGAAARLASGPLALAQSAAIAAILFVLLLLVHARGFLGGGDIKLMVAMAVGLPVAGTMRFFRPPPWPAACSRW